jgi:hypothetical protein
MLLHNPLPHKIFMGLVETHNVEPDVRAERVNFALDQANRFHAAVGINRSYSVSIGDQGTATLWFRENPEPQDGDVTILGQLSSFSLGTEGTFANGTNVYLENRFDPQTRLFHPFYTSSDEERLAAYPKKIGYMESGQTQEGVRYAGNYGRITSYVGNPDDPKPLLLALPPLFDPLLATEVAQMGPIAINGSAVTDTYFYGRDHFLTEGKHKNEIGKSLEGKQVLVMGAGGVGMRVAMYSQHMGADVVVADIEPKRLVLPKQLDMSVINVTENPDVGDIVKQHWDGIDPGADVVFECTGHIAALPGAVRAARKQSLVTLMSFYSSGNPEQNKAFVDSMKMEVHHNGPALYVAQIGNIPRGLTQRDLANTTVQLLKHPQYARAAQNFYTHLIPMSESQLFLNTLRDRDVTPLAPYSLYKDRNEVLQSTFYVDEGLLPMLDTAKQM